MGEKDIIGIWDLNKPNKPSKILVIEGKITTCVFSPGRGHIVFAGTMEVE